MRDLDFSSRVIVSFDYLVRLLGLDDAYVCLNRLGESDPETGEENQMSGR
jgi:hypothetical protein